MATLRGLLEVSHEGSFLYFPSVSKAPVLWTVCCPTARLCFHMSVLIHKISEHAYPQPGMYEIAIHIPGEPTSTLHYYDSSCHEYRPGHQVFAG